jgi:transposase-like protein
MHLGIENIFDRLYHVHLSPANLAGPGRNVLARVPPSEVAEVAPNLRPIFQAARQQTAERLAADFAECYGKAYPKAVAVLSRGLQEALTYTAFPSSHHR